MLVHLIGQLLRPPTETHIAALVDVVAASNCFELRTNALRESVDTMHSLLATSAPTTTHPSVNVHHVDATKVIDVRIDDQCVLVALATGATVAIDELGAHLWTEYINQNESEAANRFAADLETAGVLPQRSSRG